MPTGQITEEQIELAKDLLNDIANGPIPVDLKQSTAFNLLCVIEYLHEKVSNDPFAKRSTKWTRMAQEFIDDDNKNN